MPIGVTAGVMIMRTYFPKMLSNTGYDLMIVLLFFGAMLLSGCDGWKLNCSSTVHPMVGKDRTVFFYAKNYIYVDPSWSNSEKNQYVNSYAVQIPKLLDGLNSFFNQKGVNIQIIYDSNLQDGEEIVQNADMLVVDLSNAGTASGKTLNYVASIAKNDRQNIHIHWAQKSTAPYDSSGSSPCYGASGDCNWIIIADKGISVEWFAHEFGHYFGIDNHDFPPGNFMHEYGGSDITAQQISTIWNSINKFRTHLWYYSCKNP
jgi:hypothetical protein